MEMDPKLAVALAVGVIGLLALWWRRATSFQRVAGSYYSTLPPGKWGFPVLGEFLEFMFTQKHNHGQFVETRKAKYGSVFSTHLFGEPIIIASGTEDVKMVLQNEGKLFHAAYPIELTGNTSAPAISGEPWKDWRRFALSKVVFLALNLAWPTRLGLPDLACPTRLVPMLKKRF